MSDVGHPPSGKSVVANQSPSTSNVRSDLKLIHVDNNSDLEGRINTLTDQDIRDVFGMGNYSFSSEIWGRNPDPEFGNLVLQEPHISLHAPGKLETLPSGNMASPIDLNLQQLRELNSSDKRHSPFTEALFQNHSVFGGLTTPHIGYQTSVNSLQSVQTLMDSQTKNKLCSTKNMLTKQNVPLAEAVSYDCSVMRGRKTPHTCHRTMGKSQQGVQTQSVSPAFAEAVSHNNLVMCCLKTPHTGHRTMGKSQHGGRTQFVSLLKNNFYITKNIPKARNVIGTGIPSASANLHPKPRYFRLNTPKGHLILKGIPKLSNDHVFSSGCSEKGDLFRESTEAPFRNTSNNIALIRPIMNSSGQIASALPIADSCGHSISALPFTNNSVLSKGEISFKNTIDCSAIDSTVLKNDGQVALDDKTNVKSDLPFTNNNVHISSAMPFSKSSVHGGPGLLELDNGFQCLPQEMSPVSCHSKTGNVESTSSITSITRTEDFESTNLDKKTYPHDAVWKVKSHSLMKLSLAKVSRKSECSDVAFLSSESSKARDVLSISDQQLSSEEQTLVVPQNPRDCCQTQQQLLCSSDTEHKRRILANKRSKLHNVKQKKLRKQTEDKLEQLEKRNKELESLEQSFLSMKERCEELLQQYGELINS